MKKLVNLLVVVVVLIVARSNFAAVSGEADIYCDEYPRHGVDLRISFWGNSSGGASVNLKGVSIDVGTGGVTGKIMYNYYSNPELAFTFGVGLMSAEVNVKTFSNYTSTVAPVMMGLKYYFVQFEQDSNLRPYLSGSFGVLVGMESGVKFLSVGTHTETAIGGYAGFGTDIILGSLVKLHADIGYNLISDFNQEIAGKRNYSGAEFSFGVGFMF